MIEKWLLELENKFADVIIDEYVIMPNHVHFIIHKMNPDMGLGSPVQEIVGWFKTMTTNEYIRNVKQGLYLPFKKRLWQRNYYEHIIRNEQEYIKIAEYIRDNPNRWAADILREEETNA